MIQLQVLCYLFVGAASALTQFIFLTVLLEIFAFPLNLAVTVAYVASVLVHFLGNKYFTFNKNAEADLGEGFRYLVVVVLNYITTLGIVWFFVGVLNSTPYLASVLSIGATVGTGFVLSKYWVFKKEE